MATKEKNSRVENKRAEGKGSYPLGKINFILMGVCLLLIVIGFWLMTGSANTGETFNKDLFESSRVTTGPIIAFLGFVLMAFAILYRRRDNKGDITDNTDDKA